MGLFDYFRTASTWSPDKLRRFLEEHPPGEYHLIDVRQPKEYERGHLPGAVLIPVAELEQRAGGLDRTRPTIAY